MKNIISISLCLLMLFACVNVSAQEPISVELDAYELEFDSAPINVDGRILVPVRTIFESMGADVLWDGATRTVTSKLDNVIVVMAIDNLTMWINGEPKTLDVAPQIINDRTMVPARYAAESFGAKVFWDGSNNTVEIFTDEFYEREKSVLTHKATKVLSEESKTTSDFSISYFPEYDIKTDANDGTDFEIISSSDDYSALLSVRADVYVGPEHPMTEQYAKSVAEGMSNAVFGTLVSTEITTIKAEEFIHIQYNYTYSVNDVKDNIADVEVYMGIENGVVYTMTYTHYGSVPRSVAADINYMMNTLVIH